MTRKKILAVVCPNGLGHFRRMVAVLNRLIDIHSNLEIELACERWQVERLSRTFNFSHLWRRLVSYRYDITADVNFWTSKNSLYESSNLIKWEERLDNINIESFDLVLSDNLAGILSRRPDSILMGSFLWSDVLERSHSDFSDVRSFVSHERHLLDTCRPPMLCVGGLAMPGVLERTRAVQCNFMFYDGFDTYVPRPNPMPPWTVSVLSGAENDTCWNIHQPLIEYLHSQDDWNLVLPKESASKLDLPNGVSVPTFDFSPAAYRSCDIIVARPGMGTIHDSLAAGIPLLCSYEYSLEMAHLANRLESLGLGKDFSSSTDIVAFEQYLRFLLSTDHRDHRIKARASLGKEGVDQIAAWLAGYIEARSITRRSDSKTTTLIQKHTPNSAQ